MKKKDPYSHRYQRVRRDVEDGKMDSTKETNPAHLMKVNKQKLLFFLSTFVFFSHLTTFVGKKFFSWVLRVNSPLLPSRNFWFENSYKKKLIPLLIFFPAFFFFPQNVADFLSRLFQQLQKKMKQLWLFFVHKKTNSLALFLTNSQSFCVLERVEFEVGHEIVC